MQHMVLSLSTRVRGVLSVHSLSEGSQNVHRQATTTSRRETVPYAACIQCPPEDEHLRLETCRGT